ncbi:retrotransposon protein, putative, ty3-gypsy subclass [Tanacetum coccineum]|uniref:Retrotransposon protein, putative, ty3-gypsy subclass n=1 Tax=Tanacetum coccineum TaxID=301880 RepID=A0ABQ4Y5K8_9ASTR
MLHINSKQTDQPAQTTVVTDYASSPPCDKCGKLHPGKACHRVTGACLTCGSTGHMARDFPKNGGNGGKGIGNDNQPAAKGRVFSLTKDQEANSSGTVSGTLFLNGRAIFVLFDTGATHSVVSVSFAKHISISPTLLNYTLSISTPMKCLVIIDHEYQNCPLRFDDKIRSANLVVGKKEIMKDIIRAKRITSGWSWLMIGDFNVTLKNEEHSNGGSRVTNDMQDFFNCVNEAEVEDLSGTGVFFYRV